MRTRAWARRLALALLAHRAGKRAPKQDSGEAGGRSTRPLPPVPPPLLVLLLAEARKSWPEDEPASSSDASANESARSAASSARLFDKIL